MTYYFLMEKMEETRGRILQAAEELFSRYGFAKTTMVEIAGRCHMSAANIYRFFEKKEDIVAEMANRYFRTVESSLREVVNKPGPTASERLENFVTAMLSHSHNLCSCEEKINESVGYIIGRRRDLIEKHQEALRSLLAEVLSEGNRSGEFDVEDVIGTAGIILDATFMYQTQGCTGSLSLEEMKQSASRMVGLIVRGLRKG
jgi:AcrR family transcriptional regulator